MRCAWRAERLVRYVTVILTVCNTVDALYQSEICRSSCEGDPVASGTYILNQIQHGHFPGRLYNARPTKRTHRRSMLRRSSVVHRISNIQILLTQHCHESVSRDRMAHMWRAHKCWPRDLPSFLDERERMHRRAYRTSTPRTRVTEGEISLNDFSSRLLVRRSEIFSTVAENASG